MKKLAVVLGIILLGLVGAYVFVLHSDRNSPVALSADRKAYQNDRYGISFLYPNDYVLSEGERGAEGTGHYAIMLVRDADAAPRQNSEGPPGISIDIYQYGAQDGLMGWLKNTNQSNFKLSDGRFAATTISGIDGISYHWSGLYEADNTAVLSRGSVISIAVTYIDPSDPQVRDYHELLGSFQLDK